MSALSYLFQDVPAGYNSATLLKTMLPLAFGNVDSSLLQDDALDRSTHELEAVVGVLIEEHTLSTRHKKTQAEVRGSPGDALRKHGVIFKMLSEEPGGSEVSGPRFGMYLSAGRLDQHYNASPSEVEPLDSPLRADTQLDRTFEIEPLGASHTHRFIPPRQSTNAASLSDERKDDLPDLHPAPPAPHRAPRLPAVARIPQFPQTSERFGVGGDVFV